MAQASFQEGLFADLKDDKMEELVAINPIASERDKDAQDLNHMKKESLIEYIMKLKDIIKKQKQDKKKQLDIGFVYASPLIIKEKKNVNGKEIIVRSTPIEFKKEEKTIKSAIVESEKSIRFKSMVATTENFGEMLELEPKILHISCHGIRKEKEYFLLFENEAGEGNLIKS